MGRKNESGIPFPSSDPRYARVRARMLAGQTLEEAVKDADQVRPGGGGRRKKTERPSGGQTKEKKVPGTVPASDLLAHPEVSEKVKEKIRQAQGESGGGPQVQEPTKPGPLPGPMQDYQEIPKLLLRIGTQLGTIARSLERIADRLDDQAAALAPAIAPGPPRPTPASPQLSRTTENGLGKGCRVKRVSTGEVGQITRVMPGRKEAEVKFMLGTRTLPVDQLVEVLV